MVRFNRPGIDEVNQVRTKQIKVLQITQSRGGGVQKYVIQLCATLNPHHFHVTGCCSAEMPEDTGESDIPFTEAFRREGIPHFVVPMQRSINLWRDSRSLITIYQALRKEDFDIVHAHSSKAGVLARIAARMAGVPIVIYSPHAFSFDGPRSAWKKFPYIAFEKVAAWFCDVIVTDSSAESHLALKYRVASQRKLAVVPPGIALRDYEPQFHEAERNACLDAIGVERSYKLVTMIGRLAPQKDPKTFILTCRELCTKDSRIACLLVGDGPLMDECVHLVQESGVESKVKVLGWRRDYKKILQISDVLVITSLWEGLPFILLEGMAFGIPVVATTTSGTIGIIVDGKNGLLTPPGASQLLAQKVKWVFDNPERAAAMGKAARKTVEEEFTLSKTIPMMEAIYSRLYKKRVSREHG